MSPWKIEQYFDDLGEDIDNARNTVKTLRRVETRRVWVLEPKSRLEHFLQRIIDNGGGGGSPGDEQTTEKTTRLTNCKNCGAPLAGTKCEYCGAEYLFA